MACTLGRGADERLTSASLVACMMMQRKPHAGQPVTGGHL